MTPRQARTERRAAERKAKKLEKKKARVADHATITQRPTAPAPTSETKTPELGFVSHGAAEPAKHAETNRANSQFSTGPRSPAGKLVSSRNAVKHGLASGQMIIPGEDTAAFEALLQGLLDEHQPANPTEELLIQELTQSYWLSQRAIRLQNECFTEKGVDEERTGRSLPVVRVAEKRLALFLRYQTTHERAFHKALNTLLKLKKERTRGFVSQSKAKPLKQSPERSDGPRQTGFVSQNSPEPSAMQAPQAGFVPQNAPRITAEAA